MAKKYRIYNRGRNMVVLDVMGHKSTKKIRHEAIDGTVVKKEVEEFFPAAVDHLQIPGNPKTGDANYVEVDAETYEKLKNQKSFLNACNKLVRVEKVEE